MKNFFEQQQKARQSTRLLIFLFLLAVVCIVLAVVALVHFILITGDTLPDERFKIYLLTALVTILTILSGTLFRIWTLGGKGQSVATMLGGIPVSVSTQDPLEKRLLNVVEEMAIASGVPVPAVYILKNEVSINAFAAGTKPTEAVIGVTQGALERLNRDELQGVIAHEFSHIFNGDMLLNLKLIGVLAGITGISTIGRWTLRGMSRTSRSSSRSRNSGGGAIALLLTGLGLIVIGFIGVFFARLIKASVSRQREFLADASAVQYTRNPAGIGGALKKINDSFSLLGSPYAEEASHLFFGTALKLSSFFSTHPPLEERIKRVMPTLLLETERSDLAKPSKKITDNSHKLKSIPSPSETAVTAAIVAEAILPLSTRSADTLMASIGEPSGPNLLAAKQMLASIPEAVLNAVHTAEGAKALVVAALFEEGSPDYQAQQKTVKLMAGENALGYALEFKKMIGKVGAANRLSLVELAIPALREMQLTEKKRFHDMIRELVMADRHYAMFEYVVVTLIAQQFGFYEKKRTGSVSLAKLQLEASILLSAFAHLSSVNDATALEIFNGLERNRIALGINAAFFQKNKCNPRALEPAIEKLRHLAPAELRRLISACIQAVVYDKKITFRELELLRAVGAALDAPIPYFEASA